MHWKALPHDRMRPDCEASVPELRADSGIDNYGVDVLH